MANPYREKPSTSYWRKSVAGRSPVGVDPVLDVPFRLRPQDRIATGGSCFSQRIARALQAKGFRYLVTETAPASPGAKDENYGVFPARFGNIYTVRQLLQLMQRAYGLLNPNHHIWQNEGGGYIDPFRPAIQEGGFESLEALEADREKHLEAVRTMFEECDIFIFTLGLTEVWRCPSDGIVFPLAPGAVAFSTGRDTYEFHNFTVGEMESDFARFIDCLRRVNPAVKIILTVSPVAIIATYEDRHVLVSNTYSKAALRVVADSISRTVDNVCYFPSYEIIIGPQTGYQFLADDMREVSPEGVNHVMSIFSKHFLGQEDREDHPLPGRPRLFSADQMAAAERNMRDQQNVICDEGVLES